MKYSEYRFTLDLQKHQAQVSIAAFHYDTAVRLSIGITDGGVPYYLEDGCIAVLWGEKKNGEPISHKCMIEGNTRVIYDFNNTTTNVTGIVNCQLRFYKEGAEILSAPEFAIVVAERIGNDDVIDSGDGEFEKQFSALDDIFAVEQGRVEAENARVAAEQVRDGNERLRIEKEQMREEFEAQRQTAEAQRQKFFEGIVDRISEIDTLIGEGV